MSLTSVGVFSHGAGGGAGTSQLCVSVVFPLQVHAARSPSSHSLALSCSSHWACRPARGCGWGRAPSSRRAAEGGGKTAGEWCAPSVPLEERDGLGPAFFLWCHVMFGKKSKVSPLNEKLSVESARESGHHSSLRKGIVHKIFIVSLTSHMHICLVGVAHRHINSLFLSLLRTCLSVSFI